MSHTMAASSFHLLHALLTRRRDPSHHSPTLKSWFFFLPTTLALTTSLLILLYISSTSNLFFVYPHNLANTAAASINREERARVSSRSSPKLPGFRKIPRFTDRDIVSEDPGISISNMDSHHGIHSVDKELFHDRDVFLENYKEMNRSLKVFVYPHSRDDPFANVLLPVDFEPGGNYASESYFKKNLYSSHFITEDPSTADLFFLPFSIARLRHDPRVGIDGIQDFIGNYIFNISRDYPYWNRSGGADHFYVACHSIGRTAMEKAVQVKNNAIQIVCTSSYYLSFYTAHKDASLPQIWPRQGNPPNLDRERCGKPFQYYSIHCSCLSITYFRSKLAFFAGSINSPVRQKLLQTWQNDSDITVHLGYLSTSYAEELLSSKFCLHVKGFEVNTARIGDALYYGCVPVIIANHYDLPFQDILNWKSFSIVVATLDIPLLKKILRSVSDSEYTELQKNVVKVRKHFQWHLLPVDYDAFYLVIYELWIRRSSSRINRFKYSPYLRW
ncbi:probable glycosyltransferase At5g03795 isoform X2 [Andrographis paniculata]|uniref:probable glycosyltransferase At5g03795 isoform X2 n=1 Tax=Andrographis paniculata TaxID=175694 RepID=UPI0021E7E7EB|nr:probable glycosyltransferase At5g03795 isoform X2 [Andrographis paniculata]